MVSFLKVKLMTDKILLDPGCAAKIKVAAFYQLN